MMRMIAECLLFCALLAPCGSAFAEETARIDLGGQGWSLALDPVGRGEALGWHQPAANWDGRKPHPGNGWDAVATPHDYLTDRKYAFTGKAWYRRSFLVPAEAMAGRIWRLQFDGVFQRCRVWVNGRLVGSHEGGYTPFEFSVEEELLRGRHNFLAVEVDNSIKFRALPGARTGSSANAALYPWLNYGGILGGVRLVSAPSVWISDQKIETLPLADTWRIAIRVNVKNSTTVHNSGRLTACLPATGTLLSAQYSLPPESNCVVELSAHISKEKVEPWSHRKPVLYECRAALDSGHAVSASFGFRNIEIRDARFLVNGLPVRLGGANRARGHPVYGGIDPDESVARDMGLMKEAGLVFARIQHTPPGRNLIDWADRNGMLLVLEVGIWGYTAPDLASEELQSRFREEMRELIVLAQNSPSVVGWSLGNEYESWTVEGINWTRRMAEYIRSLDPTRPVTFAALGKALRKLREDSEAGEHAFDYVDYISANYYFKPEEMASFLDQVHERWQGKPVAITEFGLRADQVNDEQRRIAHFDSFLAQVLARPWICGISFWSFNDYASRYPGTGIDGYRRWGLVDEYRNPRSLYDHIKPILRDGIPAPK